MAYTDYTPDQINQFLNSKGSAASDPWAMLAYAKQYNADPMKVAAARGIDPAQAQQWLTSAQQQLSGPIADTRGLADSNPYMAYNLAQQRGYTGDQAASLYGKSSGDVSGWLGSTGLSLGGSPGGTPPLQVGGKPTQAANSPANPYAAPSTTGSTPAAMPGGNGAVGVPDYMVSPPNPYTQQPRNPYMPAGGPGSNGANDPRMSMGNQGFGGLTNYLFQNPSTLAMGNEVARGVNDNLMRNIMPTIRGNAMGSGTVGGSRQGVAEGLATGESMKGLAGALANLYGNQFSQDRGYGLQSDALDFNIHRGNLSDMRQGQMDQLGFLNQMTNWGQQGVGVANQTRDRPFTDWQRFVGPASQMAGLGSQQTQNLQGNPYLGALGGYMTGSKMFGG